MTDGVSTIVVVQGKDQRASTQEEPDTCTKPSPGPPLHCHAAFSNVRIRGTVLLKNYICIYSGYSDPESIGIETRGGAGIPYDVTQNITCFRLWDVAFDNLQACRGVVLIELGHDNGQVATLAGASVGHVFDNFCNF